MFGRVTYARCRCKARALSILPHSHSVKLSTVAYWDWKRIDICIHSSVFHLYLWWTCAKRIKNAGQLLIELIFVWTIQTCYCCVFRLALGCWGHTKGGLNTFWQGRSWPKIRKGQEYFFVQLSPPPPICHFCNVNNWTWPKNICLPCNLGNPGLGIRCLSSDRSLIYKESKLCVTIF